MKDITVRKIPKLINLIILLIPISFLFHFIETSIFVNGSIYAFSVIFLFILLAGIISVKIKFNFIFIINILSILLSMILGKIFIVPPNESWFKPFGMNFAILFIGIIIFMGILIVRLLANRILK